MNSPAFQFYAGDWLADANVQLMSLEEEGCYIRLLAYCWREGSIPSDPEILKRLCKGGSTTLIAMVTKCFQPHPEDASKLIHSRLEKEREKQRNWHEKSVEGGKNSAKKRWEQQSKKEKVVRVVTPNGNQEGKGGVTLQSSSSSSYIPPTPAAPAPPAGVGKVPKDDRPTSPEAIAIAELFHRRLDTHWTEKEIKAYRDGVRRGIITVAAIEEIKPYYAAERAKGNGENGGRHRRDLKTFLNNFGGELDRARAATNGHHKPPPDYLQTEWPAWLAKNGFPMVEYQFAQEFQRSDFHRDRKAK